MQNPNDILSAIAQLTGQLAGNVPMPSIPSLNVQFPNATDINSKWQEFLQRAQSDPDIVNYYNNLLNQAKGDTDLAISFINRDYQMGSRFVGENLDASLKSLGLTFGQENRDLAGTQNQRGIALTQGPDNTTPYAGGGEAATELGNLNQSQSLRQEAEKRSASQQLGQLGLNKEKAQTTAGQQLVNYGNTLQQQKQADVLNRSNMYFGAYQGKVASDYNTNLNKQLGTISSGGQSSGGSNLSDTQKHTNPSSGVWDDNYYANTGKYL